MISAPILGAYADHSGKHKEILTFATISCALATLALSFCEQGMVFYAAFFMIISNFSYSVHQDISAAYLVNICDKKNLGRVSGFGWAWGFLGGIFTLLLCLTWISLVPNFHLHTVSSDQLGVSGSLIITAAIFAVVSLLSLSKLNKPLITKRNPNWSNVWKTFFLKIKKNETLSRDLFNFLLCIFVYQSGIATVITIAAIYAKEVMGFTIEQIILLILVVNITAFFGAFVFGWVQDYLGHKKSLLIALWIWFLTTIIIFFAEDSWVFWLSANLAGLAMGASQSGARAAIAYLSPAGSQATNFGLWGFAINAASIIGPFFYGLITLLTDNNHRVAILGVAVFFLLGIVLLLRCSFVVKIHEKNTTNF